MASEIVATNTFKNGYKHLSLEHKRRVDDAIKILAEVDNPRLLGVRKKGPLEDLFAYEIGQQIRLLYAVVQDKVILLRVGTHTRVYR